MTHRYFGLWVAVGCLLGLFSLGLYSQDAAQPYGVAAKRPVIGGACANCPWGALADKVKAAMVPLGYDVQVCYVCSGDESTRIVAERRTPQARPGNPRPPAAPVDFGVTAIDFLTDAYHGIGLYKNDPPKPRLRLLARIEDPNYWLIATRREAFITDLRQIRERHLPARIIVDHTEKSQDVLRYYGITREDLESWGGEFMADNSPERVKADVILHFGTINNTPESNLWYEISQKSDLRFLQLPDDLLADLAKRYDWEIGDAPLGLLRGIDRPIKSLRSSGTVIYGRDDLPDQFAYDVARAMDEGKHLLIWSILPFSLDPGTVWRARDVPVHSGAAKYYREKGYMK
jgi:uncharacterized protein